jgi:hypothetical protein
MFCRYKHYTIVYDKFKVRLILMMVSCLIVSYYVERREYI